MIVHWVRVLAILMLTTAGIAAPVAAQDGSPAGKTDPEKAAQDALQKETDAFVKRIQEQGAFDDEAKAFVTKVALQKLRQTPDQRRQRRLAGGEKFEASLDRIRDALSGGKGGAAAGAGPKVREAAAAWLVEQARSGQPSIAANATMVLGDLRSDGKPWVESGKQLAAIAADAGLPPAVRAAAVAGLARHVDEVTAKALSPEFVEKTTPALLAIVTTPTPAFDPAGQWLVSRALDLVPSVVPQASPEMAKALMAIVSDQARSMDERVRAATALGATTTAESGVDSAQAVTAIHSLATAALKDSLEAAKDRALAASLSSMPLANIQQSGLPDAGSATPVYPLGALEVERDAWRLLKLSEAVAKPKFKKNKAGSLEPAWAEPLEGGLARLLEDNAAAVDLAKQLRTEIDGILENPTALRVSEARETITTWTPPRD
jgi:hypothetical protein